MLLSIIFYACTITDTRQDKMEQFYQLNNIKYCYGWVWPKCYDCSGIMTKAYRSVWYTWPKLWSQYLANNCKRKKFVDATRWDILVLLWDITHTAYISKWYKNGSVKIIDYVDHFTKASERKHWYLSWVIICDWTLYI